MYLYQSLEIVDGRYFWNVGLHHTYLTKGSVQTYGLRLEICESTNTLQNEDVVINCNQTRSIKANIFNAFMQHSKLMKATSKMFRNYISGEEFFESVVDNVAELFQQIRKYNSVKDNTVACPVVVKMSDSVFMFVKEIIPSIEVQESELVLGSQFQGIHVRIDANDRYWVYSKDKVVYLAAKNEEELLLELGKYSIKVDNALVLERSFFQRPRLTNWRTTLSFSAAC